jgi:putative nucleotidyltransferase with HDIG domain
MPTKPSHFIDVDQLLVGLYVHLDLGWMDHPFPLSNFKLKDIEQIEKIKKIGLTKVRYDPTRSDCAPQALAPAASVATEVSMTAATIPADTKAAAQRLKQLHQAMDENEKKFIIASDLTRQATRNILRAPQASIAQAALIVDDLVETALMEGDVAIHALNGNRSSDLHYQHSLNVTVLALMLAKTIEMSAEDARLLGMAAIFHDIGKAEVSDKILLKKEALTKSEQSHFEQHCAAGARMAEHAGLSARIGKIILQHHELYDGSGYPNKLLGEKTDPLARLIALVNTYDGLCNPHNLALARTPYEALAHMFAHQRSKLDKPLLKCLIKSLGIYPAGSIVQLSTGAHAIVVSSNPNKPLRPFVMLHDRLVKRQEPLIVDLRDEPSINISVCLRPSQLPSEVLHYLNPRQRVSYFLDAKILMQSRPESAEL